MNPLKDAVVFCCQVNNEKQWSQTQIHKRATFERKMPTRAACLKYKEFGGSILPHLNTLFYLLTIAYTN